MASVNVGEDDFTAVASAARDALSRGNKTDAATLDKLARKINLALSHDAPTARIATYMNGHRSKRTWRDVPSVLDLK